MRSKSAEMMQSKAKGGKNRNDTHLESQTPCKFGPCNKFN